MAMEHELTKVQKEIKDCRFCADKFDHAPRPVLWGNSSAKIVQISQAPSLSVHNTGKPWNDISGRRLRSWYQIDEDIFYNWDNFYITSVAHCYPGKNPKGGDNKPPKVCAEMWMAKELKEVTNDFFMLIGGHAAKHFFPKERLVDLVFNDQELYGKPCYVMPHPSPLAMRWLQKNPTFETDRLPIIRHRIKTALGLPSEFE